MRIPYRLGWTKVEKLMKSSFASVSEIYIVIELLISKRFVSVTERSRRDEWADSFALMSASVPSSKLRCHRLSQHACFCLVNQGGDPLEPVE